MIFSNKSSVSVEILLKWLAVVALAAAGCSALAQNFPSKPITYIHPYASNGEAWLRPVLDKFRERTGQPILIDFRPGANGVVGTMAMLRAPADGYTLGYTGTAILPAALATLIVPYKFDDFAFITQLSGPDQVIAVGPSVPASVKTFPEFVAWAKSRNQKPNFGNMSMSLKIAMLMVEEKTGLPWLEIPFKGGADAIRSVMGGDSDFMLFTGVSLLPYVQTGKMRLIATLSDKRVKEYPDVPTVAEYVPGFVFTSWLGFTAKAGTPKPLVDYLFRELTTAILDPDVGAKMNAAGNPPKPSGSPEEFMQLAKRETEVMVRLGARGWHCSTACAVRTTDYR